MGRATLLALVLASGCASPVRDTRRPSARESRGDVVLHLARFTPKRTPEAPHRPAPIPAADDTNGLHVVVSLAHRHLWVVDGHDTLRTATVGVGMDSTLTYEGKVWTFETPRGARRVIAKRANPTWTPPEWHYVEIAQSRHLRLVTLPAHEPYVLPDGSRILVRDSVVGLVQPGKPFRPFAEGEEIVWDSTLYIPPLDTKQRHVAGELGRYRLDIGNGYLLHGTPHIESIGQSSSHGCIRLDDDDIAWLYRHLPVGTPVIIR